MKDTMRSQTTIEYSQFKVDEMDWETVMLLFKREQYIQVMLSLIKREVNSIP